MSEFHNFMRTRRSVRRFKQEPVPTPVVERILQTAAFAPSAHNLQPWRFVVVETIIAKEKLEKALTDKMRIDMAAQGSTHEEIDSRVERSFRRINEAPVIILLCRDLTAIRKEEPEEHIMAVQSVALAGLQLLFATHAEGLGGNWICWPLYAQEAVQDALDLPCSWEPQGMIIIGHPDEIPKEKIRKPIEEVIINK